MELRFVLGVSCPATVCLSGCLAPAAAAGCASRCTWCDLCPVAAALCVQVGVVSDYDLLALDQLGQTKNDKQLFPQADETWQVRSFRSMHAYGHNSTHNGGQGCTAVARRIGALR